MVGKVESVEMSWGMEGRGASKATLWVQRGKEG
jgi:hypothetical protein